MNTGQFNELIAQLDEIRRAVNRIDRRLKEREPLPVIVIDGNGDPEQIKADIDRYLREALAQ